MKSTLVAAAIIISLLTTSAFLINAQKRLVVTKVSNIDESINAIYPQNDATLILANDLVYEYYTSYDYTASFPDKYYQSSDIYFPNPVVLKWSDIKSDYYIVRLSQKADMSGAKSYITTLPELELNDLFTDTTYYWQIESVTKAEHTESRIFSFKTGKSPRTVRIEGVSNTRDAGGMETADGYRVKEGMVYRGGKINSVTAAGIDFAIGELGIKTDLDIRSSGEAAGGSPFGNDVQHINTNGPYYHQIFEDKYKDALATEIKTFANPDNYPIYAHCSLGRDRTGTIIMLIQGLLGVDKNTMMMDYQLSFFSEKGCADGAAADYMLNTNMLGGTYKKLEKYSEAETFSEDVKKFMLDIGITEEEILSIKNILLEEVK